MQFEMLPDLHIVLNTIHNLSCHFEVNDANTEQKRGSGSFTPCCEKQLEIQAYCIWN
jgi:hypothetical protein